MKDSTKVLVVGAPRSGTTLLAGLLSADKTVAPMLPECTYVTQLIRHFHDVLHYSDPQRFDAYANDESTLFGMYRVLVGSMIETVESRFKEADYRYLVLKDPELTQLIDLIPLFFGEDSKIVYVVRDPRAVIASMLEVERKKKRKLWSAWAKEPNWVTAGSYINQVLHSCRLLADVFAYYWIVQESRLYERGRVHVARFEKIIAREEDEFERLENYLGFPVGRRGFGKVDFDFDRTDPTYSSGYGQEIGAPSTDFRKKLTRRQVRKIEALFAKINAVHGWW